MNNEPVSGLLMGPSYFLDYRFWPGVIALYKERNYINKGISVKNAATKLLTIVGVVISLLAASAQANVVISGTRVIFPSKEREVTVQLTNKGSMPTLAQAWIDRGDQDASPDNVEVPFAMTPSLFRMEAGKGQALRIMYLKEPLPTDKESIFYLNLLELPPKIQGELAAKNTMQIALRTRIKIFFRPEGLAGNSIDAPASVVWEVVKVQDGKAYALKGSNPSPYYVNLSAVNLSAGGTEYKTLGATIAPFSDGVIPLHDLKVAPAGDATVSYVAINDFGGIMKANSPLGVKPATSGK